MWWSSKFMDNLRKEKTEERKASVTAHRFHKEIVKKQPQKVTGFRRVVKFFF
jgi:hypothetical protein